ncbi:MAG: hypothetical protein HOV81_10495, partial [Kofleriaceae bacterium]|nr:hypothetical protein [Kofleriaceae bacterium]
MRRPVSQLTVLRVLAILCALAGLVTLASSHPVRSEPVRSERKLELGMHEGVQWPFVNAPIDGPLPAAPVSPET